MKKRKEFFQKKKERKWLLPSILFALILFAGLISYVIAISMRGETIPEFDENDAISMGNQFSSSFENRYPGTAGHSQAKDFLFNQLKNYTDNVSQQRFEFYDGEIDSTIQLTNIIASFYPDNPVRIMLSAHYDTPNDSLRGQFLGATENISGIATLLEIARILSTQQPNKGVDIVLFDGTALKSGKDNLFLGAKYFAQNSNEYKPEYAINLNSVGSPNIEIYPDEFSEQFATNTVKIIWAIANELKIDVFKRGKKPTIADNHLILIKKELQCIDIFDVNWDKNLDIKSPHPKSLNSVGTVFVQLIYQ